MHWADSPQRHREHRGNGLQDYPFDAFPQKSYIEVDEQSLFEIQEFHISHQLSDVNLIQAFNGLEFYNYSIIHNNVRINITDISPFVYDVDVLLSLMFQLPLFQFYAKSVFI